MDCEDVEFTLPFRMVDIQHLLFMIDTPQMSNLEKVKFV